MGHIKDRWKDPARAGKGLRWQVWYRVDGQEKCGGSFDNKAVAKRKLTELESSVQRGQWVDPTDQTIVAQYARSYAATRPHSERTAARVESMIRVHLDGTALGGRRLASVRPSEVQAWVTDRAQVLKPSTLRLLVGLVRSMFAAAALDRLVTVSPFVRVTLPRGEQERVVPLTVHQVRALADAVAPRYRALVLTQAGLGLRIGELLALRVCDVDFLRRTARVEDQIDQKTRERKPPKTPRSRRTVPLPGVVAEALAEHLREFPAAPDGLIFRTANGPAVVAGALRVAGVHQGRAVRGVAGGHHQPRLTSPLRERVAGRGAIGGGRRRATRSRARHARPAGLRAPHAGLGGSHPQGCGCGLEHGFGGLTRSWHGPGTAPMISPSATPLVTAGTTVEGQRSRVLLTRSFRPARRPEGPGQRQFPRTQLSRMAPPAASHRGAVRSWQACPDRVRQDGDHAQGGRA